MEVGGWAVGVAVDGQSGGVKGAGCMGSHGGGGGFNGAVMITRPLPFASMCDSDLAGFDK